MDVQEWPLGRHLEPSHPNRALNVGTNGMPRSDSATIKVFPPAVLHIRPVILQDVARPAPRSLAEYQRQLALVTIGEEDLAQDSVGENPRFRALVAEWDGQPAGYAVFLDTIRRGRGADCF